MKLFYYQRQDKIPNFGDELNHWLWPQLQSHLFEREPETVFVGTGTLINSKLVERVQPAKKVVLFSTGAGYESPIASIPQNWEICCVRGPLSAQQLGLPAHKAIADGALLVSQLFPHSATTQTQSTPQKQDAQKQDVQRQGTQKQNVSFMPHIHYANEGGEAWERICQRAGLRYIDPRWPVEKVLTAIASSERVLAEAMHGAIVADALRVPWIPIVTGPRIYGFKWQDWCASMELFYHPYHLPALKSYRRWGRGFRSGKLAAGHWLRALLEGPGSTPHYEIFGDEGAIAQRLANIAKQAPMLSEDRIFEQRVEQLQTSFAKLCQQYAPEPAMQRF